MSYTFNTFTGQLDATYVPVYILGTNQVVSGGSFYLSANQQMISVGMFTIAGTLTLAGDFLVL
jgi:hypothetical protein